MSKPKNNEVKTEPESPFKALKKALHGEQKKEA